MNNNSNEQNNLFGNSNSNQPSKKQQQTQQQDNFLHQQIQHQFNESLDQQMKRNITLPTLNSYSYQTADQRAQVHPHTIIGKIRRMIAPFDEWCREVHYKLEISSKKRRRWQYGIPLTIMILMMFIGTHWTRGLLVTNTKFHEPKTFVNGDSIAITNEKFDPRDQMALVYLKGSGQNGVLSAQDLRTSFLFANRPRSYHMPTPTIQLLPTYQNHYVAVIRNIYPGFHGIELNFQDKNHVTADDLQQSLKNGNNGIEPGSTEYTNQHFGALYLNKKQAALMQASPTKLNTTQVHQQNNIVQQVQRNNRQFVVLSSEILRKNETRIPQTLNGKSLLNKLFDNIIRTNNKDIKLRYSLIHRNTAEVKHSKKRVRQLYKNSNMTPNDPEIQETNQGIKQAQQEIASYHSEINADRKAISNARDRWNQLNNGVTKIPAPTAQDRTQAWLNGRASK